VFDDDTNPFLPPRPTAFSSFVCRAQVWRGALLLCDWVLHAAAGEEAAASALAGAGNKRCRTATTTAAAAAAIHRDATTSNPLAGAVVIELGRVRRLLYQLAGCLHPPPFTRVFCSFASADKGALLGDPRAQARGRG
jgi:hypothetical protein